MKVAKLTFALLLVALMAAPVLAQGGGGGGGGGGRCGGGGGGGGFMMGGGTATALDGLVRAVKRLDGITDDQKSKVDDLAKEYAPKFKALRDKSEAVLTDQQKTDLAAARKAIQDAAPADRRAAFTKVRDVMNGLSQDQKDKQAAVQKDVQALVTEVRGKIEANLTEDQKTKLKAALEARWLRRSRWLRRRWRRCGGNPQRLALDRIEQTD